MENQVTYTLIYTEKFATGRVTRKESRISGAMFKDGMIKIWYPEGQSLRGFNFTYFGEIVDFHLIAEE